ncbi:MAG: peptide chain release factor 1 [Clostridia bacterium]|jgi:peptide chain release factor 1|nr:peptide chain release factor 1 [Clostridia bacterium]CDD28166.1 peptide chain release factor 1 [Clostridium sp. CAG:452]HJJ03473.1 peptide chain release factor 1 [Clostridiaceae bacterium]
MFEKLEDVEKRFEEVSKKISDPEVIARQSEWQKLMKEHAAMVDVVEKYREYKKANKDLEQAKEMLNDKELKELAEMEIEEIKEKLPKIEEELKILLIPKDPDDDKNIICEIRAGAGGEEAALFAGTLFRMYSMYAENRHWKIDVLNENETGLGGYKEITFMVTGKGAYSRLKFESGVHRVQRVPDTESSGRIHTSTATVAVLPVVEDVEIEINPADVKMEVFRASGAGGQHVNKTSSAVRLIHEPTGIVAECQTERSQTQNREYAMRLLKSRIYEQEKAKQDAELANERKSQVGSGDRSEKIRTYNYPQGRITDHRIGMSIYQMENFLNGGLDEMIDNLIAADRAEKLKGE